MLSAARPLVAILVAVSLSLAACSGSDEPEEEATTEAPDEPEEPVVHPLTGEELTDGRSDERVFVVKIDNTGPAAPQSGLEHADLVVEQLVEGGETRFAAMYHSEFPERVAHVRSLRGTDAGIAAPVDGVVVATGGAGPSIERLAEAGVPKRLEDENRVGFTADSSRSAPYNRVLDLAALVDDVEDRAVEGSYFDFGDSGEGVEAVSVSSADVPFAGRTTRGFTFAGGTWQREGGLETTDDGFAADNLIVVHAPVVDAGYTDPGGNPVPETTFEGSGDAWVALGDQMVEGSWSKDDLGSTIEFTTADGEELPVAPGRTWLMLVPDDQSAPAFD